MISDLLRSVQSGARKNKYRVLVPVLDKSEGSDLSRTINILCTTAALPGRTLTPTELVVKGRKVQLKGETAFEGTWEMTFYNTEDLKIRSYFLDWMKEISPTNMNVGGMLSGVNAIKALSNEVKSARSMTEGINNIISNPLGALNINPYYQKDIKVEQLDGDESVKYQLMVIGAFPITVSSIEYDDTSVGEVSQTTVTFAYTDIQYGGLMDGLLETVLGNDIKTLF